jgi:hypothetical protein
MEESMPEEQRSQTRAVTWMGRLQEWSASGKSIAEWCQSQSLNYHRFIYWKGRLSGRRKQKKQNATHTPKGFVELNEELPLDSGVVVKHKHAHIHLSTNFDEMTFLRCLRLLRDDKC